MFKNGVCIHICMYAEYLSIYIYTCHNCDKHPTYILQIKIKNNTSYNVMETCLSHEKTVKPHNSLVKHNLWELRSQSSKARSCRHHQIPGKSCNSRWAATTSYKLGEVSPYKWGVFLMWVFLRVISALLIGAPFHSIDNWAWGLKPEETYDGKDVFANCSGRAKQKRTTRNMRISYYHFFTCWM